MSSMQGRDAGTSELAFQCRAEVVTTLAFEPTARAVLTMRDDEMKEKSLKGNVQVERESVSMLRNQTQDDDDYHDSLVRFSIEVLLRGLRAYQRRFVSLVLCATMLRRARAEPTECAKCSKICRDIGEERDK
jgi:hypothetical protein